MSNRDMDSPQNAAVQPVVVSVQVCTANRAPMDKRERVRAVTNMGLEGDRHAHLDGYRQVLLVEGEVLDKFGLAVGDIKENITTRGIELMRLGAGTRIQVGDAVLELTKGCEPCSRMDEIRDGLQDELQGQRGMLARVIQGGDIRVGDKIEII